MDGSGAVARVFDPERESSFRRGLGAAGFLLDSLRRRRSGRITLWGLVVLLALSGFWLMAYPVVTDVWASRIQQGLRQDFSALPSEPGSVTYAIRPAEGKPMTRLIIPKLGVNVIVVEGVTGNALRAGAGHFPESALPGDPTGNVAIAGHRTGYGEPFRHIDRLTKGDKIILETPFGKFEYTVMPAFDGHKNPWITLPTDLSVKGATADHVVTLISCDPPGTSENRLILRAEFTKRI